MKSLNSPRLMPKPLRNLPLDLTAWGKLRIGILLATGCFVISGATIFGQALPIAACVVAAIPMSLQAILAALGAIAGYFLRCEAAPAAEYAALTLLLLAAQAVFQGTQLPSMRWFMPSMAAGVCAVLGGISIWGGSLQISLLLTKVLLSFVCAAMFRKALNGEQNALYCTAAVIVSGLSGFSLSFDLGIFAACALCSASCHMTNTAMIAFALDLTGAYGQCALPALILPTLLSRKLPKQDKMISAMGFALLPAAVFLCFDQLSLGRLTAIIGGTVLGMALRNAPVFSAHAQHTADQRLHEAAKMMQALGRYLPEEVFSASQSEAEEVYDAAAERVCRCCPQFHRCWEHHAAQTYDALLQASHCIIERGMARAEDFPAVFQDNCCHFEGFMVALNQELEGMLYRRRYRMQLLESRRVLAQEFECIAEYLTEAQNEPRGREASVFLPQVGISALSKKGEKVSGDCGAYFAGAKEDFYVLLCDGMGSGEAAALSSGETVQLLQRLLKSGMSAESALKILNGTQILRQAESYTTVDLLHIDLNTGAARLYKWGAAPSFLRHFDSVKKYGTACAPPGVSIHHKAEQYAFSLKHEEILVLASDGADAQQIEYVLSSYRGSSPRELAALIATTQGEDDATAVAVSLRLRT